MASVQNATLISAYDAVPPTNAPHITPPPPPPPAAGDNGAIKDAAHSQPPADTPNPNGIPPVLALINQFMAFFKPAPSPHQ